MKTKKLLTLILSIMMIFGSLPIYAANNETVDVIILFESLPEEKEMNFVRAFGGKDLKTYSLIDGLAAKLPASSINGLMKNPHIKSIEKVRPIKLQLESDQVYTEELSRTWGVEALNLASSHQLGHTGENIKVAIIDTGINMNHAQLLDNYAGGYDFINQDSIPEDNQGHGTHVAGTIAAVRDGQEIVGVAPSVEVYALKVFENEETTNKVIIEALQWCVDNQIQITNNSYGDSVNDPLLEEAFRNSAEAGILHIAAAGNNGSPSGRGDSVEYPAKYPFVMAVAASTESNTRAKFSATGSDVEVMAPGQNILSTYIDADVNNDGILDSSIYAWLDGTSMATPHVVGAAALIWGSNLDQSAYDVRNVLNSTATDLGLPSTSQGYGLVNVERAFAYLFNTPPANYTINLSSNINGQASITPEKDVYLEGETVTLVASANTGYEFDYFEINIDGSFEKMYDNNYNLIVNSDVEIITYFKEIIFTDNQLTLDLDKDIYTANETLTAALSLLDKNQLPLKDSPIIVQVMDARGRIIDEKTVLTNLNGNAQYQYTFFKKAKPGTYTILAVYGSKQETQSFTVN